MLSKNQEQEVDNGSIAAQGGRDVNIQIMNNGLNYSDVKAIAKDEALTVFRENFPKLQGEAKALALARGDAITEDFFVKLQKENPEGIKQANSPDFQDALFTVQKEYAKAGDEELGQLLVDLLIDRTKQQNRNTLQIVLNESLHIAPKLTSNHLAALAVIFFFKYTRNPTIGNSTLFKHYFLKHIEAFASLLPVKDTAFQHLEFAGCGSFSQGKVSLEKIFRINYGGLFSKGFEEKRLLELGITISGNNTNYFITCLNDTTKLQVKSVDKQSLKEFLVTTNESNNDQKLIEQLFEENMMSDSEIRDKVIADAPFMSLVFDRWSNTKLSQFQLTSVGMAIGHANIKRLSGEFSNLSIWID